MKKVLVPALLVVLACLAATAAPFEKNKNDSGRLVTGKVMDDKESPLANAVVYLSNTRTKTVKSYIVGPDGMYRFPALSPNIDYEVYAQFEGRKSDTKTVSQFDGRQQVNINLKIGK